MAIDTTKKIKQVTYNGTEIPLSGYDTSDATVTARDMASGAIGYGKNGKVTGTVQQINSGIYTSVPADSVSSVNGMVVLSKETIYENGLLYRKGSSSKLTSELSNFGNATAADVAKGKTFTSAAGLKVVGTAEAAKVVSFSLINATTSDISVAFLDEPTGELVSGYLVSSQHGEINAPAGSQVIVYNTIVGQSWDFTMRDGTGFEVGQIFVDATTGVLTVAPNLTGKNVFVESL